MTKLIPRSRIAAAIGLLGALAASTSVFTVANGALGSQAPAIPLGVIETDGTLDLPFDAGSFANGSVLDAALQPDGKLLIAGQFSKVHGVTRHSIARLNTDGTLDLSFDPGVGPDFGISRILLQPDGRIITCGPFENVSGANRFAGVARLNGNGSLDLTFDPGRRISVNGLDDGNGNATFPGSVASVILEADGKIIVIGNFFYIITGPGTNVTRSCIARFNSDGSFDPTYDPGQGFANTWEPDPPRYNTRALRVARQSSGKIVVQGTFDIFDGNAAPGLVRLNTDGSFDNTFSAPGMTITEQFQASGLLAQSNDQIVVFGGFTSFGDVPCKGIVRLQNSGAFDGGFSLPSFANYDTDPVIEAVTQQADGKLIVGGFFHSLGGSVTNNLTRLETNGARDAGFSGIGAGPSGYRVTAVLVRPSDGEIFAGGYFSTFGGMPRNNIAWVNSDGSLDGAFAVLAGATDYGPQIYALATQADGKILAGGFFSSFNGTPRYNLVRLNRDSTIDPSFNATLETEGSVRAMLIQPDGKILIAGSIRAVNGVARGGIVRLNPDGTLDPSFDPGTGANSTIYALALDASGNIYLGGNFSRVNGTPRPRVAKLSPTGALDPIFNPGGSGASAQVYAMASPDEAGGLVIGGAFSSYSGASVRRIARLDATTGALDLGFNAGGVGFNSNVYALLRAPDGKYYVGGLFNSFNGVARPRVARITSNGALDETFIGPAMDGSVESLALQNGKVFVGGRFFTIPPGQIARLTSSGALDPTFVTGTGIDISPPNTYPAHFPEVSALAIQSDGKLVLGGIFNQYNGTTRIGLARLTGPSAPPTPTPTPSATPTPSPSATPMPTPTSTPSATPTTLGNISTRLRVETVDNVLIGGFIVTGTQPKRIIVRAIGPSLPLAGALADPILELRNASGDLILSNNDWRDDPAQESEIIATGIPPGNDLESAIVANLPANGSAYTAIVRGLDNGTGIGVVEAYDLDQTANSKLANISTRGLVQTGDDVLIGGLIVLGQNPLRVIVRALGPSLSLSGALGNPTLELRDGNGALLVSSDNWRDDPAQESEIIATGIPPSNDLESAIVRNLTPGNYTAIVRGVNNTTGIAVVEAYGLN